jgi:hypothetical protein
VVWRLGKKKILGQRKFGRERGGRYCNKDNIWLGEEKVQGTEIKEKFGGREGIIYCDEDII